MGKSPAETKFTLTQNQDGSQSGLPFSTFPFSEKAVTPREIKEKEVCFRLASVLQAVRGKSYLLSVMLDITKGGFKIYSGELLGK